MEIQYYRIKKNKEKGVQTLKKLTAFFTACIITILVSASVIPVQGSAAVNGYQCSTEASYGMITDGENFKVTSLEDGAGMIVNAPVSGSYKINFRGKGDGLTIDAGDNIYEMTLNGENQISDIYLDKGRHEVQLSGKGKLDFLKVEIEQTVYEAEGGRLGGYAVRNSSSGASSGAVVSNIGAPKTDFGNILLDVYAPYDGVYGIIVDYTSSGNIPFYIKSGDSSVEVTSAKDMQFSKEGRKYVELPLNAGSNDVKIYGEAGNMGSVDCITVFAPEEVMDNCYEETEAKLFGSAEIRNNLYTAKNSSGITGIGPDGSAEFNVNTDSGTYEMTIWYSSPEYRGMEIYIDGKYHDRLYCPITAEDYNTETISTKIHLSAGKHKIKFTNSYSDAPDIDKIQLTKSSESKTRYKSLGTRNFDNGTVSIKYNMENGTGDFYCGDTLRVKGIEAVAKLEGDDTNTAVKSSDYSYRTVSKEDVEDGYGKGTLYTVTSYEPGLPIMRQRYWLYNGLEYIITNMEIESDKSISSNFLAPITAMGSGIVNIGEIDDGRTLFVPYDNDGWVRYRGDEINGRHISYWATSLYDNTSRASIVTGSIDHDTFKTGTSEYSRENSINFFGGFGGIWSAKDTYDYVPHGSIDGNILTSPRFFLGYFDDWRDGMEAYGDANTRNIPMLEWKDGVPFGYNSWYGQGSKVNYNESIDVSNFIKELGDNDFKGDNDVAYINLDSYWDSFSDDQLKQFVEHCHVNGQRAGIYWSHFVFWSTEAWWNMGVPGYDYTYRDAVLEEPNGGVAAIQKDSGSLPMDPTSDAMKARLDYIMNKFIDCGFEFLKIDFLNYAALEGNHRDPDVKTGMQAYNQALKMFTDYVDTDKFFLSYSIAPLFPYQYAHARRISCDTADDIGETSYMLNSLNYGWWEDNTLYQFTDPDHISFAASATEARTRYNSAVICGTMMLLSDSYKNKGMRELTKELTSNEDINALARKGKAFRPVEGNTGQWTNDLFTLDDEDGFYLAVFNYERTMNKKYNIDLERIGLEKDTEYSVTDMWSGKNMQVKDIMSIELHPEESCIYKIKRGNNR